MQNKKTHKKNQESDGSYVLKLVLYLIIGSQWVWVVPGDGSVKYAFPIGLLIGLWFVRHERFQIDRKIEYALLLVAVLIGFWAQIGVFINQ